ncbi:hypothetical protein [Archangium sp.]|uniref:hypothetical protein n=1 Tax=Archangium sp. TaxID=1872627 RepID=UPI00286ACC11|nr:hypothetical protein [Archangium sp.]
MKDRVEEPKPLFNEVEEPEVIFSWGRCLFAMLLGAVGMVLCLVGVLGGVSDYDKASGYPLGYSGGYLIRGHLTSMSLVAGTPLGAVLGAYGAHVASGGRGRFWVALVAVLVSLVAVAGMCVLATYVIVPALLLLPVVVGWVLERDASRSR